MEVDSILNLLLLWLISFLVFPVPSVPFSLLPKSKPVWSLPPQLYTNYMSDHILKYILGFLSSLPGRGVGISVEKCKWINQIWEVDLWNRNRRKNNPYLYFLFLIILLYSFFSSEQCSIAIIKKFSWWWVFSYNELFSTMDLYIFLTKWFGPKWEMREKEITLWWERNWYKAFGA